MDTSVKRTIVTFLYSFGYFLILSIAITFLFLPGYEHAIGSGAIFPGIIFIVLAVLLCYFVTVFFLKYTPPNIFPGTVSRTLTGSINKLSGLVLVLVVFAAAFAILAGLVTLLIYRVFFSGVIGPALNAINISIVIIVILSLPFFISAFSLYASGESAVKPLFTGSVHMGGLLYIKYLAIGAIAFGLAYFIHVLAGGLPGIPGVIVTQILTSLVLGAALIVSWRIYSKRRAGK